MTYAGLLSLIYARLDADDVRVQAAKDWTQRHWTLEENPGMGPEGLYYFFVTLSKCMAAMGEEQVVQPDGTSISWREDLLKRLVALQQADGSWVNDNNRWWEADPGLVTSYTLLAIASALE
jgi:squalene-hopene/tetraprenyl-beta-curcumene cyclase